MNKKNKNIPALRFPEFDGEWKVIILSKLLDFKNGINASKEDYGQGYKFINVLDVIENNFITYECIKGFVNISKDEFEKNKVQYGDVLFQRSSETREEVGQANVYLDKDNTVTFGGFVIRGKKKVEYSPEFMNYLLKTSSARKEITSKSGGSTRYNVGQEILSKVKIITTNIEEQQKVASFLKAVDKRIELLEKKKEKLEEYKKGVMQKIFSQEICFKDDEGKNFPDWEMKKLYEICSKKSSNLSINKIEKNKGKYKIFGADGFIKKVNFYLEENDFIAIVKDGAGVGRTMLCEKKSSVLGTMDLILPLPNNNLYFLLMIFKRINFKKYTTGSTIPHIYFKDYSRKKIKVPISSEQQKIASFLSSIDKKIEKVTKEIGGSKKFKKGLLQKMFV